MNIFPEDIDNAVGGFNACDRCGSVTHTPFDRCPVDDPPLCPRCGDAVLPDESMADDGGHYGDCAVPVR